MWHSDTKFQRPAPARCSEWRFVVTIVTTKLQISPVNIREGTPEPDGLFGGTSDRVAVHPTALPPLLVASGGSGPRTLLLPLWVASGRLFCTALTLTHTSVDPFAGASGSTKFSVQPALAKLDERWRRSGCDRRPDPRPGTVADANRPGDVLDAFVGRQLGVYDRPHRRAVSPDAPGAHHVRWHVPGPH